MYLRLRFIFISVGTYFSPSALVFFVQLSHSNDLDYTPIQSLTKLDETFSLNFYVPSVEIKGFSATAPGLYM